MRNPAVERLDVLVGEWTLTLTGAWFLESPDVQQTGHASVRWIGEGFVELVAEMEGEHIWHFLFGADDPGKQLFALYHDPRPTSRVFRTTFDNDEWTMLRQDPDFHQRFFGALTPGRIEGRWEASDDQGTTWRKDFDLIFERLLPA
jgi:hypothetical protein